MPHVRTQDLDITFFETGAQHEKPILLLHGWPDDATTWNRVAERLKDRDLRFVIPYLRGFGTRPSAATARSGPRTAASSPWMRLH
jgi:pimeloyl-ACP methyl ester carboxylesterase